VVTLLALLGELEGHLDGEPDPQLVELRMTIGAALAALHRADAEARLRIRDRSFTETLH
jgi:hypothetical protein